MSEEQTMMALQKEAEEKLLQFARSGDPEQISFLLQSCDEGGIPLNINVKGQQKSNFGWSALHLASYFGHADIVELLITHGAEINIFNNTGDTPLHKAAYTGRKDIVMLLLSNNANVFIKNGIGQTAWDVSRTKEIYDLLKGAEKTDLRKKNDALLYAAREGDVGVIEELLKESNPPDINCVDSLGNTALHCAAYCGKHEVAVLLLQKGIDPSIKNSRGQLAKDLALNPKIKQLLSVVPMKHLQKTVPRFEGSLLRKSRFLGWRETWTVLEKGVMSFFKTRADSTTGSRRKGYKYLDGAEIMLDENDSCSFVMMFSNGARQRYSVPVASSQQVDRQKWVNAISEHVAFSTHYLKQGVIASDEDEPDIMPLATMQDKLQTALAHQQLLEKQVESLKPACESFIQQIANGGSSHDSADSLPQQLSNLVEFSRKVSSSLSHCLTVFSQQEEKRLLQSKQQKEQIRVLQDAFHALAQEHHELERSFVSPFHSPPGSPPCHDTDCEEFYDAFAGDYSPPVGRSKSYNSSDIHSPQSAEDESMFFASFSSDVQSSVTETARDSPPPDTKWGRAVLPVTMFSRNNFSLWSILKQCIGRELTKITMPVVFNEPLSFLQRVCENVAYCELLEKANACNDPLKRIEFVTAFAIASLSSNYERLAKPFNPLLGETFELSRNGEFRLISEQVSHHPPVSAFHLESENFTFYAAIQPKLKLWARSVEAIPEGTLTLHLTKHNEVYTWCGMKCVIHNIIVGKLWMEMTGIMQVTCHTNGLSASVNYKPAGWFRQDLNVVEGFIYDSQKTKQRFLYGKACTYLRSTSVEHYDEYVQIKENSTKPVAAQTKSSNSYSSLPSDSELNNGTDLRHTLDEIPSELLWEADPRPPYSSEYYNFTSFAMALNELTDELRSILPETDSRFRPDVRKLEEGDIDGASSEKNRLEEKQRETRKRMKKEVSEWKPLWFEPTLHTYTKEQTWAFKNNYWDRHFENCPNIF